MWLCRKGLLNEVDRRVVVSFRIVRQTYVVGCDCCVRGSSPRPGFFYCSAASDLHKRQFVGCTFGETFITKTSATRTLVGVQVAGVMHDLHAYPTVIRFIVVYRQPGPFFGHRHGEPLE